MVDGETDGDDGVEELVTFGGGDIATTVRNGNTVREVDVHRVAVTERRKGSELQSGRDGVASGNDTVKTNFV